MTDHGEDAPSWEYLWHRVFIDYRHQAEHLDDLNALGAEGWEATGYAGQLGLLLKRRMSVGGRST